MASDIKSDLKNGSVRHYSPSQGDEREQRLAPLHGNPTPPRISPSRPHCLKLWLGGSIIVDRQDYGKPGRHGLVSGRMDTALHLIAVIDSCSKLVISFGVLAVVLQVVLAHPPVSLFLLGSAG